MPARGGAAAAAQDELAAHELAIIFADRAGRSAEAGIGAIGAAGPFPDAAEHLLQRRVVVRCGGLDRPRGIELVAARRIERRGGRFGSEEHTSELQSLMRNSYAVFCLNK